MNKGIIIIVVIVLVLIVGGMMLFKGDKETGIGADNVQPGQLSEQQLQDGGYEALKSDDDVFNTIEESLDLIE